MTRPNLCGMCGIVCGILCGIKSLIYKACAVCAVSALHGRVCVGVRTHERTCAWAGVRACTCAPAPAHRIPHIPHIPHTLYKSTGYVRAIPHEIPHTIPHTSRARHTSSLHLSKKKDGDGDEVREKAEEWRKKAATARFPALAIR